MVDLLVLGGTLLTQDPERPVVEALVVLSANPLDVSTESIAAIAIEQTYLAGRLVFER